MGVNVYETGGDQQSRGVDDFRCPPGQSSHRLDPVPLNPDVRRKGPGRNPVIDKPAPDEDIETLGSVGFPIPREKGWGSGCEGQQGCGLTAVLDKFITPPPAPGRGLA